jgi:NAD(P)-dependent dehydrogenase (short-subunit alcohol dehydrogenase family)
MTSNNNACHRCYLITGASGGVGLEATRQLALHFLEQQKRNHQEDNICSVKIYMLCRSEQRTRKAIESLEDHAMQSMLQYIKFDAYDTTNIDEECIDIISPSSVDGILLNAGGFGDSAPTTKTADENNDDDHKNLTPKPCKIAQLNIIGHAILINKLLSKGKINPSTTRIVAVGSEAAFTVNWNNNCVNIEDHLLGTADIRPKNMGIEYGWIKGIVALYWSAFARHNNKNKVQYVATVSPGAITETNLLSSGSVSPFLRGVSKIAMFVGGSHSVDDGAKRYVDALLGDGRDDDQTCIIPKNGAFYASRKGYAKDYGDVTETKKGQFVANIDLQDKVWETVNKFV